MSLYRTTVTGVIYVVIIALWIAVLIPMWLRRLDHVSEARSTARFSSSMELLGSHVMGAPVILDRDEAEAAGRRRGPRTTSNPANLMPLPGISDAARRASIRRATVLGGLSIALVVTGVLAAMSLAPVWAPIVAAVLVLSFVLASALTASTRSAAAPIAVRERATPARPRPAAPAAAPVRQSRSVVVDDGRGWEAVPTTLPTYVSAPRASVIPRPIDRSRPGEWTGSAMVEAAQTMRREIIAFDSRADTAEIPAIRGRFAEELRAANE